MENSQKLVVVLLVVAILFSAISIIISIGVSNLDLSGFRSTHLTEIRTIHDAPQAASLGLVVEKSSGEKK